MPRLYQFAIFLGIVSLVLGTGHYYVYSRLVQQLALAGGARIALGALLGGLLLLSVAMMPLNRTLPRELASPLAWVVYTWMGTLLIMVLVFAAGDILHLAARPLMGLGDWDPQRRALFTRWLGLGTLGVAGGLVGLSLWEGLRKVGVRQQAVTLKTLPPELHGLRIVQLTDLHIGSTIDGDWLRRVVAQTNALDADIIAITGDLVDGSVDELHPHVAPLSELRARHGVFFVTGNHEYFSGAPAWIAHLATLGVRVLRNERITVYPGASGHGIDIAGVDDFAGRRLAGHGPDFVKALGGRDSDRPLILLAHQPLAITEAAAHGVDLQISGHTHGGQMWPWRYLVLLQQPYVAGLYLHPGSKTQIYVSTGTGYWGPPMRLGTTAEITHITLHAEAGVPA